MRNAISPYKNCCASKGARRLNCWMTWLLLMGKDLGSDMKIKDLGNKRGMKSWGRHGAESMQKAAFGNHHRDLHCKQGWLSVHTNPLENGLNAVRLKVSAGRSEEHTSELQSRGHLAC